MTLGIHNVAEIIAAVVCTYCFLRKPSFFNRWFTPFLWFVVIIELTGKSISAYRYKEPKMLMYNFYTLIEFLFYLNIILYLELNTKYRKILIGFIAVFIVFGMVNLIWIQGLWEYNYHTLTIGSILLVTACLLTFLRLFSEESSIKWPYAFVLTGILIFYTGNFVPGTFMATLTQYSSQGFFQLYSIVNHNLNVVFYLLLSMAFTVELVKQKEFA